MVKIKALLNSWSINRTFTDVKPDQRGLWEGE